MNVILLTFCKINVALSYFAILEKLNYANYFFLFLLISCFLVPGTPTRYISKIITIITRYNFINFL